MYVCHVYLSVEMSCRQPSQYWYVMVLLFYMYNVILGRANNALRISLLLSYATLQALG